MTAGIIPARAGFTGLRRRRRRAPADHPRSRGVYGAPSCTGGGAPGSSPLARGLPRFRGGVPQIPAGSSPLARGLPQGIGADATVYRIIPARAGFTRWSCPGRGRNRDHPRSRGVYKALFHRLPAGVGSSPLARGLRVVDGGQDRRRGIIPARAGFTRSEQDGSPGAWDHPRSRGVYIIIII